jgi:hypothetical protein
MKYNTARLKFFFVVITLLLLYLISLEEWKAVVITLFPLLVCVLIYLYPDQFYEKENRTMRPRYKTACLTYHGDELSFSKEDIISILNKHSVFYSNLDDEDKDKFIKRLIKFIDDKTFKIHDKSGFREMPVLISSTAIQLSFGLEKYLLPHFTYINIHPEEFLGLHPTIRFLEGNVSGNSINISWKYFLHGFQYPMDGKNVGLHEMAHAYHYQNFGPCEIKDEDFICMFNKFNESGNPVFTTIQDNDMGLYSNYARKNYQEFWAESIELFFEKPMELRANYPLLYQSICDILNQDPIKKFI